MNLSFEKNKNLLHLFKEGHPADEVLKQKMLDLAKAGISHINFDLAKIANGERAIEEADKPDPAHDYLHMMRVLNYAENFPEIDQDKDVLRAAVIFHDLITHLKAYNNGEKETEATAQYTEDLLRSIGFPEYKIPKVLSAIKNSSAHKVFSLEQAPKDVEAFILFTADKLDQSGAIAIMRYFASGGHRNRPSMNLDDPTLKKNREPKKTEYENTVDGLLYRMPAIEEKIDYGAARETIEKRNDFFYDFIKELEYETTERKQFSESTWTEKGGAFAIIKIFENCGREGKPFYHELDPFAANRTLEPNIYPLDAVKFELESLDNEIGPKEISERRKAFLQQFLNEVKFELSGEIVPPSEESELYR